MESLPIHFSALQNGCAAARTQPVFLNVSRILREGDKNAAARIPAGRGILGYDCVFSTSTLAMALGALWGTCTSIPLAVCENFSGLW